MAGKERIEERSRDFEGDAICWLGLEGGLQGSSNKFLYSGCAAEWGDVFYCDILLTVFHSGAKERAEALFQDTEASLAPKQRYLYVSLPFVMSLSPPNATPEHFWSIPYFQFPPVEELCSFSEDPREGYQPHPPPTCNNSDFFYQAERRRV